MGQAASNCPVCGAGHWAVRPGTPGLEVAQCRNCGFVRVAGLAPAPAPVRPDPARALEALRRAGATDPVPADPLPDSPAAALAAPDAFAGADSPGAVAARLATATAPGGLLYISTPNYGDWRRPRDLRRWRAFRDDRLFYLTPFSLTLLLERHNLRVVRRRPSLGAWLDLVATRSV